MNWLHFFLWIAGIYGLYYLVILLADLTLNKRVAPEKSAHPVLTFSETVQPKAIEHEAEAALAKPAKANVPPIAQPEVIASGGVILKNFFSQAMLEKIVYTQQVTY